MRLQKKNSLRNFIFFDPRSLTKIQKECAYWKAKAEGEKLAREAVQDELAKLEKYTEFGVLALKAVESGYTDVCQDSDIDENKCGDCPWCYFCRKRAELLAEGCNKKQDHRR